ncbi:hypothetical protein HY025_02720 [Candidatus Daviesbacteria bacterium]|nr:hypothetical protein [Candidatus Daviesbacteria bacterium]
MFNLSKNLVYYIFVLVLILIFVSFLFFELTSKKESKSQPTSVGNISTDLIPSPGSRYNGPVDQNLEQRQRDLKISQLIKKLPYQASNFYLDYYFSNFSFVLTLYKGKEDQGEKDFIDFLNQNGILSKDWLKNLIIRIQ